MKKIKCSVCLEKDAVWLYMPGSDDGNDFYCDDCVPRGCTCNVYSLEEFNPEEEQNKNVIYWNRERTTSTKHKTEDSFYFEPVDEKWRRFPCCEYDYSPDGYEVEENDNLN